MFYTKFQDLTFATYGNESNLNAVVQDCLRNVPDAALDLWGCRSMLNCILKGVDSYMQASYNAGSTVLGFVSCFRTKAIESTNNFLIHGSRYRPCSQ